MMLTVKLFATFRDGRFVQAQREYPPGTTCEDIVKDLAIPIDELGVLMLSGRQAELTDKPAPGDTVAIFPKVGGG
jgi:molybdopterin converting factor small subunit